MIRRCVVCGAEFITAPSNNKITCSKACSDRKAADQTVGLGGQKRGHTIAVCPFFYPISAFLVAGPQLPSGVSPALT